METSTQSDSNEIVPSLSAQLLSWSHYEKLLQVYDKEARDWYAKEAFEQTWGVRTLQRNISTQYYYRLLKSQDKKGVEDEMKELTTPLQNKLEFTKNTVVDSTTVRILEEVLVWVIGSILITTENSMHLKRRASGII